MRPLDLVGKTFGRLTVLEQAPHVLGQHTRWRCRCECGNETILRGSSLSQGLTKSCGCSISDTQRNLQTKHGLYYHSSYATWNKIMDRCYNPSSPSYLHYGGRGIFVDPRWHDVKNFIEDMGERPLNASIDRIDNNRGYSPGNCRWPNPIEQANNRRNNVFYAFNGRTQTVTQWSRELGFKKETLRKRLCRGISFEEAISNIPNKGYI